MNGKPPKKPLAKELTRTGTARTAQQRHRQDEREEMSMLLNAGTEEVVRIEASRAIELQHLLSKVRLYHLSPGRQAIENDTTGESSKAADRVHSIRQLGKSGWYAEENVCQRMSSLRSRGNCMRFGCN